MQWRMGKIFVPLDVLRVVVDCQGRLDFPVEPLHLGGLRIVWGSGNMFNPPREALVIKAARLGTPLHCPIRCISGPQLQKNTSQPVRTELLLQLFSVPDTGP
jgi:hypothetical protein